jgi:hypothetical protein
LFFSVLSTSPKQVIKVDRSGIPQLADSAAPVELLIDPERDARLQPSDVYSSSTSTAAMSKNTKGVIQVAYRFDLKGL